MGISLWQTVNYDEAELLVREIVANPGSRLARAIARTQTVAETPVVTDAEREAGAALLAKMSGL